MTRVDAKDEGVTVVTRPSASVVATPTADEAVISVGVEMDAMALLLLDPDGVTKRVEVLTCQQALQFGTSRELT